MMIQMAEIEEAVREGVIRFYIEEHTLYVQHQITGEQLVIGMERRTFEPGEGGKHK